MAKVAAPFTEEDLICYADYLVADYRKQHSLEYDIIFELGRKYIKVIQVGSRGSQSVNSFIERSTGNILKAATWKSPTLNFIRGNVQNRDYSRCAWTGCI